METYEAMADRIVIRGNGTILVRIIPGRSGMSGVVCPTHARSEDCNVNCAKCSVYQETVNGKSFWTVNSCGCKRHAKMLAVETQDSFLARYTDKNKQPEYELVRMVKEEEEK